MDKLSKMRKEYEEITAPKSLYSDISKLFEKERKRKRFIKTFTSTAASFVLCSFILVNVSSSFAVAMSDIPVIRSIVKVLTLGKYVKEDNGYQIDVTTPKLEGLNDKETQDMLNKELKENADAIISEMEKDIEELKKEFGDAEIHMGVYSNYDIKTDNEDLLVIDVYVVNTAGSSSTIHNFYNINKKSGKLIAINDVFKEDSDYKNTINQYIHSEMERRNKEEDGIFWTDDFIGIDQEQKFYINSDNQIVICFDKYEISAGAQGCPEFILPSDLVKDFLK